MLIRKLHRMGTSVVLTIPTHVIRRWGEQKVRHVIIEDQEDHLVIRPLSLEQLIHYPAPEEEDLPRGSSR